LLANGGFLVGVTPLSGTVSDDTVSILSGLGASGLSLTGTTETIFSGGVTIGTTIGLGSTENISSGGVASGTIVSFGNDGETVLAGGKSISSLVMSGATESVDGIAIGTTVYTGGTVSVYSARSATSIGSTTGTVLSGGTEIVTLGSATSTIVLAGGVLNDGAFASATIVSSGGTELLTSGAVTAGEIITPNGSLSAVTYPTGSSGTASGTVVSNGGVQMVVDGLAVGATILSGGIQSLTSSGLASSTTVSSGGTEIISAGGRAIGTTLAVGAMIDLPNVEYISGATAAAASGGVLTVMEYGVTTYTQTLAGTYTGDMVSATQDSGIGTLLTILAASPGPVNVGGTPCYCRGTLILTDQGERPVETLAIGDRLVTQSGALRPIRWIGRRSYAGRFANGNATVLPVCFKAGSLAAGQPRRDLFVSPLHAMAIDGVLIPAALLVNGITILQADTIDQVDYIHLELDTHDVIWAEGAASETFIDDGSRGMFHNAQDYAARYPDADRQSPQYCAPRLESGAMLEAIKLRLAPRPHLGTVRGVIDMVTHDRIAGWACMPGQGPLRLSVTCDGVVLGSVLADEWRPDLQQAGFGTGHHSFSFDIPGGLIPGQRYTIEVTTQDGQPLSGSPWTTKAIQAA
jgi:autotransporter passenger strand-loop-strand repeat protein